MEKTSIAVANGDGIGPEIMQVVLHLLKEVGAPLDIHSVEIGEKVYLKGYASGIEPSTWEILKNVSAFLKAPITTPQGGGFKSLNVTIRGAFSLYANVRPCIAYSPIIPTKHPEMDLVIIRENEEDLYTGIEYQSTADAVHAIKIITRSGCERIIRYAFDYALANKRKKVTCFTKDNILKQTDGLFHHVFDEISADYPTLEKEHWIVDIGAAKLADHPEQFDVLVMPNLYGDILSDVAAQIAGSVGLAGSANIGHTLSMFEAIHGSAPRRAGQNLANPSGLLLASVMMLNHLGLHKEAHLIHNAWLATIEEGIHTYDIFQEGISREKVGTKEFGASIAKRIGKKPSQFPPATLAGTPPLRKEPPIPRAKKSLTGVDLYLDFTGTPEALAKKLQPLSAPFTLSFIANRGTKVWPDTMPDTLLTDYWRCRFEKESSTPQDILRLQERLLQAGLDIVQVENLLNFN